MQCSVQLGRYVVARNLTLFYHRVHRGGWQTHAAHRASQGPSQGSAWLTGPALFSPSRRSQPVQQQQAEVRLQISPLLGHSPWSRRFLYLDQQMAYVPDSDSAEKLKRGKCYDENLVGHELVRIPIEGQVNSYYTTILRQQWHKPSLFHGGRANSNYDGNAEVCNVSENREIQRIIRVEQRLTDMEARSIKSVSDQRSQVDTLKNDFGKRIPIVETKIDSIFELC